MGGVSSKHRSTASSEAEIWSTTACFDRRVANECTYGEFEEHQNASGSNLQILPATEKKRHGGRSPAFFASQLTRRLPFLGPPRLERLENPRNKQAAGIECLYGRRRHTPSALISGQQLVINGEDRRDFECSTPIAGLLLCRRSKSHAHTLTRGSA